MTWTAGASSSASSPIAAIAMSVSHISVSRLRVARTRSNTCIMYEETVSCSTFTTPLNTATAANCHRHAAIARPSASCPWVRRLGWDHRAHGRLRRLVARSTRKAAPTAGPASGLFLT